MTDPQDIIPLAATLLIDLAQKPREQIQYTPEGVRILETLKRRGMVSCTHMTNLSEQNLWSIEYPGLKWLDKHGLLP